MRHPLATTVVSASMLALVGCASNDHVLFVTKTSIGIDFDSKPGTAAMAYDRVEGYIAPTYANGEVPPVVASIKSDGAIFSPRIRQVYATGDAAVIATGGRSPGRTRPLKGQKGDMMFFGTTTTTGLKVGFTTALPDSFIFGFKRKESSYIPVATVGTGDDAKHAYPSVLASIDTAGSVATDGQQDATALTNSQFFATGQAARNLAKTPEITSAFNAIAAEAMATQKLKVEQAIRDDAAINGLLDDITDGFSDADTTPTQQKDIVAAAKAVGADKDATMTVANFEKRLTIYSSTYPAAEVSKTLKALKNRVNALLGQ